MQLMNCLLVPPGIKGFTKRLKITNKYQQKNVICKLPKQNKISLKKLLQRSNAV